MRARLPLCLSGLEVPALKYSQLFPPGHTHAVPDNAQQRADSAQGTAPALSFVWLRQLVCFWCCLYRLVSGTFLSILLWIVNFKCLGDGADGAATLVLHGLPSF